MFRMLFKKCFFDLWDNLLGIVLLNLLLLPFVLLVSVIPTHSELMIALKFLAFVPLVLYIGCANLIVSGFSESQAFGFKDLPCFLAKSFRQSLVMGLMILLLAFGAVYGIPYYLAFNSFAFYLVGGFLFWIMLFAVLILQYFWPLNAKIEKGTVLLLRQGLKLLMENFLLSVFFALVSVILLALTIQTYGIFPGLATILLWNHTALRLLILKYEYREKQMQEGKSSVKRVDWKEALKEEHEKIGHRTFKDFLFPWKQD